MDGLFEFGCSCPDCMKPINMADFLPEVRFFYQTSRIIGLWAWRALRMLFSFCWWTWSFNIKLAMDVFAHNCCIGISLHLPRNVTAKILSYQVIAYWWNSKPLLSRSIPFPNEPSIEIALTMLYSLLQQIQAEEPDHSDLWRVQDEVTQQQGPKKPGKKGKKGKMSRNLKVPEVRVYPRLPCA